MVAEYIGSAVLVARHVVGLAPSSVFLDITGVIQVMSNDPVDVRQGHGRKFLGDFLSRRSGTESGHDRIERHTGSSRRVGKGAEVNILSIERLANGCFDVELPRIDFRIKGRGDVKSPLVRI
jgi:hypothetical protein